MNLHSPQMQKTSGKERGDGWKDREAGRGRAVLPLKYAAL